MKIDPDQSARLSSEPITFDISRLANEAHTHAFQQIFARLFESNRDLFPDYGQIRIESCHPFELSVPPHTTAQEGKRVITSVEVTHFFATLSDTALFLYQSRNDSIDLLWESSGKRRHLFMAFDNPYFVMKE